MCNETPIFVFESIMEKQDYRKFLYTATFLRNSFTLPLIALISLLGALFSAWLNRAFSVIGILLIWVLMFAIALAVICLKVERKNKRRVSTDRTGTFDSTTVLKFYTDCMVMESAATNGTNTLKYEQFYELLESKEYYIFYFNVNLAALLRKKDIPQTEGFKKFISEKFKGKYKTACNVK